VFCSLLLIGIFYSPAPYLESLSFFKKYRVLLFIPIILSLTKGMEDISRNIVNALLLGYGVLLANAVLVDFGVIAPNHLSLMRRGGGFFSIFAYLAVQRAFLEKEKRVFWAGLFLVICYDIFFILSTRTGWLIFAAMTFLFIFQYFSFKKQLILYAAALGLGLGILFTSATIQEALHRSVQNLQNYDAERKDARTSLGFRLDWYQNSLALIKERPIFGHGTGSFEFAQRPLIENTSTSPTDDPHNEFLLTTVQIGSVGLVVLLLLFVEPARRSFKLLRMGSREQAFALQATVLFLLVGCFFNSWLLSSIPSHIFAFLIVAFYPYPSSSALQAFPNRLSSTQKETRQNT
jgi:O-antigen ligase